MALESGSSAPFWFKFFLDAGIPPADAGNYAVSFTDNRIQPDMVIDLTKDYLNDMGITALGDVIAILKHAKTVYTKNARERALKGAALLQSHTALVSPAPVQDKPTPVQARLADTAKQPVIQTRPATVERAQLNQPSLQKRPTAVQVNQPVMQARPAVVHVQAKPAAKQRPSAAEMRQTTQTTMEYSSRPIPVVAESRLSSGLHRTAVQQAVTARQTPRESSSGRLSAPAAVVANKASSVRTPVGPSETVRKQGTVSAKSAAVPGTSVTGDKQDMVQKSQSWTPRQTGTTVTMAAANTDKTGTQQQQQQTRKSGVTKQSVFDRLGGSHDDTGAPSEVSSTKSLAGSKTTTPSQPVTNKAIIATVFSRLGGMSPQKRASSSTVQELIISTAEDEDDDNQCGTVQPTAGVVKKPKKTVTDRLGPPKTPVVASGIFGAGTTASSLTLKQRLGEKLDVPATKPVVRTSVVPTTTPCNTITLHRGPDVMVRLGPQRPEVSSTTQDPVPSASRAKQMISLKTPVGVFSRLGRTISQ